MASPALTALAAAVLRLPQAPERALVLGCDRGDGAFFLAREFPAARVRGLDPSAEAVQQAVARVGLDPEGRVAFKRGSPRRLPYPDELFDLVAQDGGRLHPGELARVLRRGGHALLIGGRRWADWRLRMRGFEALEPGEADGVPFLLARLGSE